MEQIILGYNLKVFLTTLPIFLLARMLYSSVVNNTTDFEGEWEDKMDVSDYIVLICGVIMVGNALVYLLAKVWL